LQVFSIIKHQSNAGNRNQNARALSRHSGMPLAGIHSDVRHSGMPLAGIHGSASLDSGQKRAGMTEV
jgi:hypothetical protein